MERKEKAWYVVERAELMTTLFLQDLGAKLSVRPSADTPDFDYLAVFTTDDLKLRIVAVAVKATEEPINGEFRFQARPDWIKHLQNANVPVLFLVVNVKHNEIYYGWAKDISYDKAQASDKTAVTCKIPVVNAENNKEEILKKIFA